MTWGSKTKYRHPDRRRWNGWQWFMKSKYGPIALITIVGLIIGLLTL